jgi:hypothetical protein
MDLPRFRGGLRAWDQGIWSEGILLSCTCERQVTVLATGNHSLASGRYIRQPDRGYSDAAQWRNNLAGGSHAAAKKRPRSRGCRESGPGNAAGFTRVSNPSDTFPSAFESYERRT